jgi:hypothetical protein
MDVNQLDRLIEKIGGELFIPTSKSGPVSSTNLKLPSTEQNDQYNDLDSIDSDIDIRNIKQDDEPTNQKMANIKVTKKKVKELVIKSADLVDDPNYYNDYLVNFSEPLKNVTGFTITDVNLPPPNNNVHDTCCSFTYKIGSSKVIVSIDQGCYEIDDILTHIESILRDQGYRLTILKDQRGRILIKNLDNEVFTLYNGVLNDADELIPNNLLQYLGFTNESYNGKSFYKSETPHNFHPITKIHMFLEGVIDGEMCEIDLSNQQQFDTVAKTFDPISELSEFIIKFKIDRTGDAFYDFKQQPHTLNIAIEHEVIE